MRISVQHEDPADAQQAANSLVEALIEESQRMNSDRMSARPGNLFKPNSPVRSRTLEQAEENWSATKRWPIVTPSGETSSVVCSKASPPRRHAGRGLCHPGDGPASAWTPSRGIGQRRTPHSLQ